MTLDQRQKHTYIIGKTGTGKTTLLKSSIYQDMYNGKGLAVLDPHGDMFRELLSVVPENRRKDVVIFDHPTATFQLA
jgi:type IV secretory pathway VirB4 component